MGKNGRFGKDHGKIVGKGADGRPGRKGSGYVKKQEPQSSKTKSTKSSEDPAGEQDVTPGSMVPIELQQLLLNIYRDAFPEVLTSETLQPLLQDIKAALYARDFASAFGKNEYLEAYSIRWSPSRSLCYLSILVGLRKHLSAIAAKQESPNENDTASAAEPEVDLQHHTLETATHSEDNFALDLHIACFGGGAAETIAFGGLLRYLQMSSYDETARLQHPSEGELTMTNLSISDSLSKINLLLIDAAHWQDVVRKLHDSLIEPPVLSKYASAAAKAANTSLLADGDVDATFRSEDVLQMTQTQLDDLLSTRPMLVTLLFTLNELYTTSISKTTVFLLNLTMAVKPGSLLLVVDSPGSYSQTSLGSEAKKYPMVWLMDHTLLETRDSKSDVKIDEKNAAASWVKVVSEDSKWFRMPEELRYPIPLENMRYQMHLYKRV